MKKGRHRRFEEARALKRSTDIDFDSLLESLQQDAESKKGSGPDDLYEDDEHEDDDAFED